MSPDELKRRIVELVRVKQDLHAVDTEGLWEWHLPRVAATEAELAAVEQAIGEGLDRGSARMRSARVA